MSYSNLNTSNPLLWIGLGFLVLIVVLLSYRKVAWEMGDEGRWTVAFFLMAGLFAATVAMYLAMEG